MRNGHAANAGDSISAHKIMMGNFTGKDYLIDRQRGKIITLV